VDGSHIRTLLLTFLYRQVPDIIERGYIYIAQPPLYRIKSKNTERYVLDDKEMDKILVDIVIDDMVVTDLDTGASYETDALRRLFQCLIQVERGIHQLGSRGLNAEEYLQAFHTRLRRLPMYCVYYRGEIRYFYSDAELAEFTAEIKKQAEANGESISDIGISDYRSTEDKELEIIEIHEAEELSKWIALLEEKGISLANKTVLDKPRFRIERSGNRVDVTELPEILPTVREMAKKGLNINRFKGLGEMNPDQLWETTMAPESRTLLKVELKDAVEADNIFTILMGDQVEPRKAFIERFALQVHNLDV
jgi:DNA gyrase subunit B